jgi:membrane peptidoglycan carboxypeptidase
MVLGTLVVDLAWTWWSHRGQIAMLADSVPETTAFMQRRILAGEPVKHQQWAPLESLPVAAVCAVQIAEDPNFFIQGAFDWRSQRRMLDRVLRGDFSSGASGIPQQLARNLYLSPDRTVRRKLREYVLAAAIDAALSKERQLEIYVNIIEWGPGVWGIVAGSDHLFGRPPRDLRASEVVLLAGVLPLPARGIGYPLTPPRRSQLLRITTSLWRAGILYDVDRSSVAARLAAYGALAASGQEPGAAIAIVGREMGEEPVLSPAFSPSNGPWGSRCDRFRRVVQ